MPSLICIRGSYYAQFYDSSRKPTQKQIPLKTKDKRAAKRSYVLLQREIALGKDPWDYPWIAENEELPEDAPLLVLAEGIASFFDHKIHLRPSTLKTYQNVFHVFLQTVHEGTLIKSINKVTI